VVHASHNGLHQVTAPCKGQTDVDSLAAGHRDATPPPSQQPIRGVAPSAAAADKSFTTAHLLEAAKALEPARTLTSAALKASGQGDRLSNMLYWVASGVDGGISPEEAERLECSVCGVAHTCELNLLRCKARHRRSRPLEDRVSWWGQVEEGPRAW
jgi:hypothetical protein